MSRPKGPDPDQLREAIAPDPPTHFPMDRWPVGADRVGTAAIVLVHNSKCRRPTEGADACPACAALVERATDQQGMMDVAVADLEEALRLAGITVE